MPTQDEKAELARKLKVLLDNKNITRWDLLRTPGVGGVTMISIIKNKPPIRMSAKAYKWLQRLFF